MHTLRDPEINNTMDNSRYVLAVAIDFGTTFSGYAFSFKSDPTSIKMNKSWGASLGFRSLKTPTTVLVDPEGKMEAFGFEAEEQYSDLEQDDVTPDKYTLYQKFKMMLHKDKVQFLNFSRRYCVELLLISTNNSFLDFLLCLQYI